MVLFHNHNLWHKRAATAEVFFTEVTMSTHENMSGPVPSDSDRSEQDLSATLKKQGIIIGAIAVALLIAALFGLI